MIKTNKVVNPPKQTKRFTTFIKTVIDETKRGERTNEGKIFKNRTVLSYNTTYNNLLSYETHIKKNLNFSDINIKFYNKYIKYLNEKSFAPNTIGGHIKNIKVFMKLATKRGLNDNLDFSDGDFKKISEETQTIYLTETELQTIYNTDLSKNKHLIPIRDIFLIGCYTGLRFSDLKQLRKEHFYDNVIKIETEKTGKYIIIPIHPTVSEIYNKYEFNLPRVISNQKMNEYIKDLGEIAKINEIIEISETRGGLKVKKNVLKYDLITVHTARRSFATNMYLADFPILAIRMITGHRTERAFLTYIKINAEENAKKMLEHPYFNQSNNLKVV
ncbi:MAG: phage integrase SAM-like domain-containing protein [Bacteroidetes bacterium]|nr:phage integrase SAM-like domain-containing protein [Bacteroidota bacterium]